MTRKVGFYNKTHTLSQHGDVARGAAAAAPPALQPAEDPAANLAEAEGVVEEDADANPDALQWEGAYCSTAEDASDVLGTGGVVSVPLPLKDSPNLTLLILKRTMKNPCPQNSNATSTMKTVSKSSIQTMSLSINLL